MHKVHIINLDHRFVCPLVRTGSPRLLSRKRVCPPPGNSKGGGTHCPAGEGGGGPRSDDWRKSLALCLLCDWNVTHWIEAKARIVNQIRLGKLWISRQKSRIRRVLVLDPPPASSELPIKWIQIKFFFLIEIVVVSPVEPQKSSLTRSWQTPPWCGSGCWGRGSTCTCIWWRWICRWGSGCSCTANSFHVNVVKKKKHEIRMKILDSTIVSLQLCTLNGLWWMT